MKANLKKIFTAAAAAVMCAVPMANSLTASAASEYIALDRSIKNELRRADLTKLDTASIKADIGTLDIDARIPIDPDNPTIPRLPEIRVINIKEPNIRDLKKPLPLPNPLPRPTPVVLQSSQVVEQIAKYTYYDSNNRLVTVIVGYTTDGEYIAEYFTSYIKINNVWKGILQSRTKLGDPAYNTSLVTRVTKTEYYLDYSYRLRKEITGFTKNGNRIVENWRFSDVTGKWELISRKITPPIVLRPLNEAVLADKVFLAE
jgi:hypothetical protein